MPADRPGLVLVVAQRRLRRAEVDAALGSLQEVVDAPLARPGLDQFRKPLVDAGQRRVQAVVGVRQPGGAVVRAQHAQVVDQDLEVGRPLRRGQDQVGRDGTVRAPHRLDRGIKRIGLQHAADDEVVRHAHVAGRGRQRVQAHADAALAAADVADQAGLADRQRRRADERPARQHHRVRIERRVVVPVLGDQRGPARRQRGAAAVARSPGVFAVAELVADLQEHQLVQ